MPQRNSLWNTSAEATPLRNTQRCQVGRDAVGTSAVTGAAAIDRSDRNAAASSTFASSSLCGEEFGRQDDFT